MQQALTVVLSRYRLLGLAVFTFLVALAAGVVPVGSSVVPARASTDCSPTEASFTGNGTVGTTGVDYRVLTFDAVGQCTWSVPAGVVSLDVLVVGGGGGGGGTGARSWSGGGGGGGQVIEQSDRFVTPGMQLTISVGDGGSGGGPENTDRPTEGEDSSLVFPGTDLTAVGGGRGGHAGYENDSAPSGGSRNGGGAGAQAGTGTQGVGYTTDSDSGFYAGGTGHRSDSIDNQAAGGGAGAGANGGGASSGQAGAGGTGTSSSITGSSTKFGGGGGGGKRTSTGTAGSGGAGGGGAGAQDSSESDQKHGAPGVDGLGGGGGGGGGDAASAGGDGGSGVAIVRYSLVTESVLTTDQNDDGLSSTEEIIPTDVTVGSGFTAEMWVYPESLGNTWNTLLFQHSSASTTTNYDRFGMNIRGDGAPDEVGRVEVVLDASDANTGGDLLNYQKSDVTVAVGEWTHVALVVEYLEDRKFSAEVFIDGVGLGVVEKSTSNDLDPPAKGQFRMGFHPAFPGREFDGHIEQFKVWDVPLTESEVNASKSAYSISDSTPPLSDLRLHHDFNALNGSNVDEVVGDGTYDLARVNGPTVPDPVGVSISSHPSDETILPGNSATVSVTAGEGSEEPTTLSYQWQQDSGSGFADIPGATAASYTSPVLETADSGVKYRAIISSSIAYEIETLTTDAATITVEKTSQTLSLDAIGDQTYGDAVTVSATATSGLPPTFSSSTTDICTIDASTGELTLVSAGTCTVAADQGGDDIYSAATQQSETFTISAKPITVDVAIADKVYDSSSAATVSSGALAGVETGDTVSFDPANASADFSTASVGGGKSVTVTLDGDELTGSDAGKYSLTVSGSPTASITPKPVTVNVTPAGKTYDGTQTVSSFTISLSGVVSDDTVSIDSEEVDVVFDAPGAGTQTASATLTSSVLTGADAENYSASVGTVSSAVIAKASQGSLSFTSASSMVFGQPLTLVATGGSGSGEITYAASGDCTLSSGVITPTGAGSCSVTARREADSNYLVSSTASQTVTISKANQSINFTSSVPVSAVSGTTYTPAATATSDLPVSFDVAAPGKDSVCSISGSTVTFITSGTCVVEATRGEDSNYNAATKVTQTIVAGKINQTITFPAISGKDFNDPAFAAGATVSSGRSVTFATSTGSVCAVDTTTGVVSIKTIGDCTVTASSSGDASYAAASDVSRTFTIRPVVAGKPSVTSVSFGDSAATLGFVAPGNNGGDAIDGYQVVATSSGGSVTKPDCSTSSPCTITGLTNGEAYTLTVAAVNAAGVGPASSASPSITPATVADAVSGLATTPGDEELAVSWTALTDDQLGGGTFTRYDVYLRVNGGAWGSAVTVSGSNNLNQQATNSYTFTGLANGTAYDVKIVAITAANSTELASNTSTALGVPATVPDAPTGLVLSSLSNTSALASWVAPVDDGGDSISGYDLNLSCTFVNATDTFCTMTGLTAGSRVTVTVGATNLMGTSATVSAVITMPGGSSGSSGTTDGNSDSTVSSTPSPPSIAPSIPRGRLPLPPRATPNPRVFDAPVLPPGFRPDVTLPPRALIGGIPAPVTTEVSGSSEVRVRAGSLQFGLSVPEGRDSGKVGTNPASGVPELSVRTGQSTRVAGAGLLPGSSLQLWLPSTLNGPRELARIPVLADGSFDSEVALTSNRDEDPLPVGRQVVQVAGFDQDGNETVVDMTINIGQGPPRPEPNRDIDALPDLVSGQTLTTSAGMPEAVRVEVRPEQRQVAVLSGDWSFEVTVREETGQVADESGELSIQLVQEKSAEVSGSGFQPDSRVDVWLFSEPTLLGSVTVSEDGSFATEFYLDPRFADPGEHTLQLQGVGSDGYIKAANVGVEVFEPPAATTATASLTLIWGAIVAVVALALVVLLFFFASRRRISGGP